MNDNYSKIKTTLTNCPLAIFCTLKEDYRPWARYMMVTDITDNMEIIFSSSIDSRKVIDIKHNNEVHITAGGDDPSEEICYLQISGHAEVVTDVMEKEEFWNPELDIYFDGPFDPRYCIIKVKPYYIEIQEGHNKPKIVTF